MSVQVNEILDFLVAKSMAPSTFGAQLDRMKYGLQSDPDPFQARDNVEADMLQKAQLLRCISDFEQTDEYVVKPERRAATGSGYKVLDKLRKYTKAKQGALALCVLRSYHERSTQSQERGLLEIYKWIAKVAPEMLPKPPKDTTDLLQSFRTGEAKRCRDIACECYADALLCIQVFCRKWNKEHDR